MAVQQRPRGEEISGTAPRNGGWRRVRLRLRRFDGSVYLDRWGFEHDRIGGLFLHRMDAADPGEDLHDHPWTFVTLPIWGGYIEEREQIRRAPMGAQLAAAEEAEDPSVRAARGWPQIVRRFRPRVMRLDECHRIVTLTGRRCWTLVLHGPVRRRWGFYLPSGYIDEREYDETVRVDRRDLWNEAT